MRRVVAALLAIAGGCTEPNPRSCIDGLCTDQRFPFCDVDGSIAGQPQTCVAVTCSPGEFTACRDDDAVTCNGMGNSYDLTQCQFGCSAESAGCRECLTNAHCSSELPICESTDSHCRACRSDNECDSQVCDAPAGTCVDEASIVYASPTGSGSCSKDRPCSLTKALTLALMTPVTPTVRLLPGTYTAALQVTGPTSSRLRVVATGATLAPTTTAIVVQGGGDLELRGASIVSTRVVNCGMASTPRSSVSLRDSAIVATGNSTLIQVENCDATLSGADFSLNTSETMVLLLDDSSLVADRVHAQGATSHHIVGVGQRISVELTNSLLFDIGIDLNNLSDAGPPGSRALVASSTIVYGQNQSLSQGCENASSFVHVTYENSIIAPLGPLDAVQGTHCMFVKTLLSRQGSPPAGTFVGEPRFLDAANHDFHVTEASPAVDAAVPSTLGIPVTTDLDGVPRPQGAAPDLGAYERAP